MLMRSDASVLLLVDLQERLLPAMAQPDRVVRNAAHLVRGARELGVPVVASEQYPKGIGPTVAPVRDLLGEGEILEKIEFSCARNDGLRARISGHGRQQVVVAGIEAHVCLLQTALDLVGAGHEVFAVADATSSRLAENHERALDRMAGNGVGIVTTEMVLFEWMERAGTETFKTISRLIR